MVLNSRKELYVLICRHTMDVSIAFERSLCKSHHSDYCPGGDGCLAMGGIACHNTGVINMILDLIFPPYPFTQPVLEFTLAHTPKKYMNAFTFVDIFSILFFSSVQSAMTVIVLSTLENA